MTVLAFPRVGTRVEPGWRKGELDRLMHAYTTSLRGGDASEWEVGATEAGDPQFYLVGPPPDHECVMVVSRLGDCYVLEDGCGRVLFEDVRLDALAEQAMAFLRNRKSHVIAKVMMLWCALRHAFEEKVEPVLVEGEELLTHVAPQLAALA